MTTQPLDTAQIATRRRQLGRFTPRSFSGPCRHRFDRDRRASLIARCGGRVTEQQALIIDQMIAADWTALRAERDAATAVDARTRADAGKIASEARRLLLLLDRDLVRATPPPAPPNAPGQEDRMAVVNAYIERRLAEEAA